MKKRKYLLVGLACLMALSAVPGCSTDKAETDGKVTISIGEWPDEETLPTRYAVYENYLQKMNEKYPNIEIVKDTYKYEFQSFLVRASAGQIPDMYNTYFTEIDKLVNAGYAADITEAMSTNGYDVAMNPDLLELVTRDGKIYALPYSTYAQGLTINRALFEQAGLVDEAGNVMVPETYDEVAQMAQQVKERTGQAGFVLPTTQNNGGWHFMNIAWSYGVDFMEQVDGKWTATFNTPECAAALQYVKDLKWKYDVLPADALIDRGEMNNYIASDQAAMCFSNPPGDDFVQYGGMSKDNIAIASVPAGPAGRYAQMGGDVRMISPDATPEQIDAIFKWFEIVGDSPELTPDASEAMEANLQQRNQDGFPVLDQIPFKIWVNEDRIIAENTLNAKYMNINPANFEHYYAFKDVIINPEEPVETQSLYAVLDACIQEVLTNENADPAALIENAANEFQHNYLDKVE